MTKRKVVDIMGISTVKNITDFHERTDTMKALNESYDNENIQTFKEIPEFWSLCRTLNNGADESAECCNRRKKLFNAYDSKLASIHIPGITRTVFYDYNASLKHASDEVINDISERIKQGKVTGIFRFECENDTTVRITVDEDFYIMPKKLHPAYTVDLDTSNPKIGTTKITMSYPTIKMIYDVKNGIAYFPRDSFVNYDTSEDTLRKVYEKCFISYDSEEFPGYFAIDILGCS